MTDDALKASILLEALPYIREFYGQTIVIKYGGHAMKDEALRRSFALNIQLLRYIGVNPVIVHGGGPQIGNMLKQLGIQSEFRQERASEEGGILHLGPFHAFPRIQVEHHPVRLVEMRHPGIPGVQLHHVHLSGLRQRSCIRDGE